MGLVERWAKRWNPGFPFTFSLIKFLVLPFQSFTDDDVKVAAEERSDDGGSNRRVSVESHGEHFLQVSREQGCQMAKFDPGLLDYGSATLRYKI